MNEELVPADGLLDPSTFQDLGTRLLELLWDPTSNLTAALLLYGIIGILVVIVIVAVLMAVLAIPDDEHDDDGRDVPETPRAAPAEPPREVIEPRARIVTLGIVLAVIGAIWLAAGYSTSQTTVCVGCHTSEPHSISETAGLADPHVDTSCVGCHEPAGLFGHYVVNVPFRAIHFVDGVLEPSLQPSYGRPTQSACLSCHKRDVRGTVVSEERGLKMSHAEPLEAAAACLDCHRFEGGIVAEHNAGMNPCLKCHDSRQASSECSTCHDRQAAAAARARSTDFAAAQVEQVRCGGCHDERRQCDPCHGVRMPHDEEFMAYAHARAATVDFWFGDGKTCQGSSCHTETRRPCTQCHGPMLGTGHGPALVGPHKVADGASCNRCHQVWALFPQRDFCDDVCHSEAARRYSPR